jgi:glycosyltransferase involved in cell wall biosynthesis
VSLQQNETPAGSEPVDITVLGVHVKSTGYPNVTFRLRDLTRYPQLRIQEINFPFRHAIPHGMAVSRVWKPLKWLWSAIRLAYAHVYVMLAYLCQGRPRRLYVPYPSTFVLFCLSLLPKSLRPAHIVADCFISLYDTVITDRKLLSSGSCGARALRSVESRAYQIADMIIVDTDLNSRYFVETFGLAASKVMALPLSIDETIFRLNPYRPHGDTCTVLFIGTFVPLQGVDVIAQAAVALASRRDIRFRLIGSGQTAKAVEHILTSHPSANVEWVAQWIDGETLADEIRRADICLGIFGSGPKTQRVWPLKNYAYMAIGRAIITGDTLQAKHLLQHADSAPFLTVPPGDPSALASTILELVKNPDRRRTYAENARRFYETNLCSRIALDQIVMQLTPAAGHVA